VLLWQGASLAYDSIERLETSQSIWNPHVWPVKAAIPLAGLLLLLQGCVRLAADIRVLMGLPSEDADFGKQADDGPGH
jgi:TRAP-type mannitol/chloroaromatic compound transport system permease small subunit